MPIYISCPQRHEEPMGVLDEGKVARKSRRVVSRTRRAKPRGETMQSLKPTCSSLNRRPAPLDDAPDPAPRRHDEKTQTSFGPLCRYQPLIAYNTFPRLVRHSPTSVHLGGKHIKFRANFWKHIGNFKKTDANGTVRSSQFLRQQMPLFVRANQQGRWCLCL